MRDAPCNVLAIPPRALAGKHAETAAPAEHGAEAAVAPERVQA